VIPAPIAEFLTAATPKAWVDEAVQRLPELLQDHANCELKAASTALAFIYRYPERANLVQRMSRLAREELRHFEQVRKTMHTMSLPFQRLSASRYAAALRDTVRPHEPARMVDMLLVAALIEARSCERFALLVPQLPAELAAVYATLLESEARHFELYLDLSQQEARQSSEETNTRLAILKEVEATLITAPDPQFRFHSGPPVGSAGVANP
jgi:tRNA 2-(methylsulfanyl)-N6-isopentenyladenosine37 hydroxylase